MAGSCRWVTRRPWPRLSSRRWRLRPIEDCCRSRPRSFLSIALWSNISRCCLRRAERLGREAHSSPPQHSWPTNRHNQMMTQFREGPSEAISPPSKEGQHVALFMANLEAGGIQRSLLHLARALADRGHRVDLVLYKAQGDFVDSVPSGIKVVALETAPRWKGRLHAFRAAPEHLMHLALPVLLPLKPHGTVRCLPALVRYLREERPAVLLSA